MFFKKISNLFLLGVIIFTLINLITQNGKANENKLISKCEIKNNNLNCFNLNLNNIFKVKYFSEPYRIQLIFKNRINIKKIKNYKSKNIVNVRYNKFSKHNTNLVIEFIKPTIISGFNYNKINKKIVDLSLTFSDTTEMNYTIAKYVLNKNQGDIFSLKNDVNILSKNVRNKPKSIELSILNKKTYKVFIDPGHGGKDPGAIGKKGTLEKKITLQTSILLAKALRQKKKIIPILSRNEDIYLSLRKRIVLAKKNEADIFISIHADSSKNKKAKGISVFSLSDKASDKEAQMLANRENEVDIILGNKDKIEDPLIYGTLIKMLQREAMNDSSFLARNILSNLEKTKLAINRGHRFAGFTVLKSYDIPSVLIEIGFLSNEQEEERLLDSKYLSELSTGLADAIENYFIEYENKY